MKTLCLMAAAGVLTAAPTLRLSNTVVQASTAVGSSPAPQTLEAYNIGDGTLSLTVWIPSAVTWVAAKVGAGTCTLSQPPGPCTPIQFTFNTSSLAPRTYSATASVFDPHAQASPQTMVVTVFVVGTPAGTPEAWMAPGGTACEVSSYSCSSIGFPECTESASTSTADGGSWLYTTVYGQGTSGFYVSIATVYMAPSAGMPDGTYSGIVNAMPITLHVTSPPYAVPTPPQLGVTLAQGGPAVAYPFIPAIALGNEGTTFLAQSVTATGVGITASVSNGLVLVSVDPGSLAPGMYPNAGSLAIQCSAVNCPVQVPIGVAVNPRGPPSLNLQGVVDNASFTAGANLAQGDIAIIRGQQLSFSLPAFAPSGQLPTTLADVTVLVNGTPAPLFYSSFGQIAFQMPTAAAKTVTVQVQRGGQSSNSVTAAVASRAPGIVVLTDTSYNLLDLAHPAKPGDIILIWAIGVGPTNPAMTDGTPSPTNPLAQVVSPPTVQIGGVTVTPLYAVLSPGFVGLYQLAATVPSSVSGNISVKLVFPEISSNAAGLAVRSPAPPTND